MFRFLGALALITIVSLKANASLLIDAGPSSSLQTLRQGNYSAGTQFTLSSGLTVDGLGWLDSQGDGLVESHMVGLWSASSQTLLASATILPTSKTVLSVQGTAQWFIEAISSPLLLSAGTYRVAGIIGDSVTDRIGLSNDKIGNGVSLSAGYVRTVFPNGGFNFPNFSFASETIFTTVTTGMFDAQVPAPATLTLFGLGLAGLGWLRRKKA